MGSTEDRACSDEQIQKLTVAFADAKTLAHSAYADLTDGETQFDEWPAYIALEGGRPFPITNDICFSNDHLTGSHNPNDISNTYFKQAATQLGNLIFLSEKSTMLLIRR